jgi:hypothetical protein
MATLLERARHTPDDLRAMMRSARERMARFAVSSKMISVPPRSRTNPDDAFRPTLAETLFNKAGGPRNSSVRDFPEDLGLDRESRGQLG